MSNLHYIGPSLLVIYWGLIDLGLWLGVSVLVLHEIAEQLLILVSSENISA